MLELSLLFNESLLDDLSSGQEPLLQVLEGLILDVDGGLLIEIGLVFETQLLQDWGQVVVLLLVAAYLFFLYLRLLHFISSFFINALFKDLRENVLLNVLHSQLLDNFFIVSSLRLLGKGVFVLGLDQGVALLLHFVNHFIELLLLSLFHVLDTISLVIILLALRDQILSVNFNWLFEDLAFLIMVIYIVDILVDIEHSLLNLVLGIFLRVKFELLGHLVDVQLLAVGLVIDILVQTCVNYLVPVVGHTAVDQFVLSALVSLECLPADLLFSVDEAILVSVVVKVNLSIPVVNLD